MDMDNVRVDSLQNSGDFVFIIGKVRVEHIIEKFLDRAHLSSDILDFSDCLLDSKFRVTG